MTKLCTQSRSWLQTHIVQFLTVLILIQPLLDVLSFWQGELGAGQITLALRFFVLIAVAAVGLLLAEHRRGYWILYGVLLLYAVLHCAAILQVDALTLPAEGEAVGLGPLLLDLANMIRVMQIPIFALCFITFLKRSGEEGYRAIQKSLLIVLLVIAAVEVLSVLTGTDPHTYAAKGIGVLGWFATTNAQSAVLSMVVPVVIMGAIQKETKHIWHQLAICALGFGMLFLFGTRLSYAAILATAVGLIFTILVVDRRRKRSIGVLLACLAVCVAAFPLSPMYENQSRVGENAKYKEVHIEAMVAADTARAERLGLQGEEFELCRIESAYDYYLGGLVEKYGLQRVAEAYDYSTEVSVITGARLEKKTFCALMMEDSPMMSHLFGLELGDMTYLEENYDLENDFQGIYMLYGWVGLLLLAAFLLYFIGLILWALLRNAKKYYTLASAGYGIALLMGLVHAYATAGVLRRPNASFYLSLILAMIYFFVLIRDTLPCASAEGPRLTDHKEKGCCE